MPLRGTDVGVAAFVEDVEAAFDVFIDYLLDESGCRFAKTGEHARVAHQELHGDGAICTLVSSFRLPMELLVELWVMAKEESHGPANLGQLSVA